MTLIQDTQELLVALQQNASPNLVATQDMLIVVIQGRTQNGAPAFFNLQKMVLTVKEATVPVRGRNV